MTQLTGWVQLYGNSYFDWPNQTIEFYPGTTLYPSEFGDFSALGPFINLTYNNVGVDLPVVDLAGLTVTATNGTVTLDITAVHTGITADLPTYFTALGTGTATMTGFDPTPGVFGLGTMVITDPRAATGWWEGIGFIAQPQAVPAPVVGGGWPALVTALVALVVLARRRKQRLGSVS